MTASLSNEQVKKLTSKMWRLNNLYTIITKDKRKEILKLNYSQRQVLTQFKHSRKIILKSRQQGISTLYIAYYLDSCITKSNYSAGIQSYGKDEAQKLAERAKIMWEGIPDSIKKVLNIDLMKNNTEGMQFSNGSIFKIGNFRGDTLQGLHVSELGKIAIKFPEKARELKTGAFEAVSQSNKITIESTAEGRSGLFYEIWQKSYAKQQTNQVLTPFDFEPIFLSWIQDPDCNIDTPTEISAEMHRYFIDLENLLNTKLTDTQKWWYCAKKETLGEDIKREYPSFPEEAFEYSIEGTYYAEELSKLEKKDNLYNPNSYVFTAWDIGVNDANVILFAQINGEYIDIINEYDNTGVGLPHYREICRSLEATYGYTFDIDFFPHDIQVQEWGSGKNRIDIARREGFKPRKVKKYRLLDAIEVTRKFLAGKVRIDTKCTKLITAIQLYRKKYDNRLGVFLATPEHDEHSHYADALRTLACGLEHYTPGSVISVRHMENFDLDSFAI